MSTNKAANITPPYESKTVIVLPGHTTAVRFQIPDDWRKQWLTVEVNGVAAGVLIGGATVVANLSATTNVSLDGGTGVTTLDTFDGGECVRIPDGGRRPWNLDLIHPNEATLYVSLVGDAIAGQIRLIRSSGPVSTRS